MSSLDSFIIRFCTMFLLEHEFYSIMLKKKGYKIMAKFQKLCCLMNVS